MNLITKETIETKEYKSFLEAIQKLQNNSISYEEFKKTIIGFGNFLSKDYLKRCNLLDNENFINISFEITDLPDDVNGVYLPNEQKIYINKKVIYNIYLGDIKLIETIFHELNHLKVRADLIRDVYDINVYRILKEQLVKVAAFDNFEYAKSKESNGAKIYYESNYELYTEELYVDILAIIDLLLIYDNLHIDIPNNNIVKKLKNLEEKWENLDRDFTYVSNNNNYHMNLFDAFEDYFTIHKEWLKDCPLLQVEYYLDENGNIAKRSVEELQELMNKETDKNKKKFIEDILLERTRGLKQKEECYIVEENEINNYNKK